MAETKELSDKAKSVMEAIISKPNSNVANIAEFMGVSAATVTGSLATLKKRGLVTVDDGVLNPTEEGNFEFGGATATLSPTAAPLGTSFPEVSKGESSLVAAIESQITESDDEAEEPVLNTTSTPTSAIGAMVADATAPAVPAAPKEPGINKAEKARAVFAELGVDAKRSVLMERLTSPEIGLSKPGANTYIYNARKAAGLVKSRGAVAAEVVISPAEVEETTTIVETTPEVVADIAEEIKTEA